MTPVTVTRGKGPIVLGMPHGGTFVPENLLNRLNPIGRGLADTDWHIERLYDGLRKEVTVVAATFHRYVIDANRDPDGSSLYPGQNTTELCPTTDFDGRKIWNDGQAPSTDEIDARRLDFHQPYHQALGAELSRVKSMYGFAILYDCHSIRSDVPFLFDGVLPELNIGSNDGASCSPVITNTVSGICESVQDYDTVVNGRFKGGWTTRQYGKPQNGTHAIQMEIAQRAYMTEQPPWDYAPQKARALRPVLAKILAGLDEIAQSGALTIEDQ